MARYSNRTNDNQPMKEVLVLISDRDRWLDMSEIRADKIHNVTGDNDSGIDLSTNDEVKIKIANTESI